jgi:hypothetical protein
MAVAEFSGGFLEWRTRPGDVVRGAIHCQPVEHRIRLAQVKEWDKGTTMESPAV